jgi:hypothetical protein
MKKNHFKYFVFLLSFFIGLLSFSQPNYIKFGGTLPGSSVGALVGKGACLSLGKESEKILNVRARVSLDLFYHKGASESFYGFNHNSGSFGGDYIESATYTSSLFLNGQLVSSLDYFLFDKFPNIYFGPDAFLSIGLHAYNQKSAAIYTSGGGLKAHLGFEKPVGKKLKIFGEYAASYVVTSPYFLIEQPTYSTDAEKKVWWSTVFHQIGIGFRF